MQRKDQGLRSGSATKIEKASKVSLGGNTQPIEVQSVDAWIETIPLKEPFRITGYTWTEKDLVCVEVCAGGYKGRGEASGVFYEGETAQTMLSQIETVKPILEKGLTRDELRSILPSGGARNAVDCALWDLEAKQEQTTVWEMTGIAPREVTTVNTVGIDTPENMASNAASLDTPIIKVKLDGDVPLERLQAVRNIRPDADIVVDANQGWSFSQLVDLAPKFKELGVLMIEQPLPRGHDKELSGYEPPLILCADESCLDTSELEQVIGRYQMINIKLDKTGGLTEALDLAKLARSKGLKLMVGCMTGTSLAMAPGFVVAQLCDFVDLDGALFLTTDRDHPLSYNKGVVSNLTPQLWG